MNIYKVWTDYFCYDGYDGHVVLARTTEEAVMNCKGKWGEAEGCNISIALIGVAFDDAHKYVEEDKIILSSFIAG